ncbi:hypothetical protein ccbrp13_32990 [Ktedonobacteria bacterium brp13]|nr:hypothetical protein ccbrp13_32990 [Ktedonobacteria bacterium brp13]
MTQGDFRENVQYEAVKTAREDTALNEVHRPVPPPRGRNFNIFTLLLIVGGVVVVVVLALMVLQFVSPSTSTPTTSDAIKNGAGNVQPSATVVGQNDPAIYWQTIQTQTAQGLHMSVSDLKSSLQSGSNTSKMSHSGSGNVLSTVATEHNVSPDQLRTIELNAIQAGCDKLVSQSALTQQEADQRMQTARSWDQNMLDSDVLNAFLNDGQTPKQ